LAAILPHSRDKRFAYPAEWLRPDASDQGRLDTRINGEQAVNVKAYGAVGDGVTNDTAAFIEASAGVRLSHPGSH